MVNYGFEIDDRIISVFEEISVHGSRKETRLSQDIIP